MMDEKWKMMIEFNVLNNKWILMEEFCQWWITNGGSWISFIFYNKLKQMKYLISMSNDKINNICFNVLHLSNVIRDITFFHIT